MRKMIGWVFRWFLVLLFCAGVILHWNICAQVRAELDQANATIGQLQAQIDQLSTADYRLELSQQVCIAGIFTLELDSVEIRTDRTTYESCRIGGEYPSRKGLDNFLLTSRVVVTGMEDGT